MAPVRIYYDAWYSYGAEWKTYLIGSELSYQDLGVLNGTIKRVEHITDIYGNISIKIVFDKDDYTITKISEYLSPNIQ